MRHKAPKYVDKALKCIQNYCSVNHCDYCPYKIYGLNGFECIFRYPPKGWVTLGESGTYENGGDDK